MRKFPVVLIVLVICLLVCYAAEAQFLFFRHPLEGKPAPDFTLNTLSGQNVNFTALRGKQPAILFFWATWCPHCRKELQALSGKQQALEAEGVKLFFVDIEETAGQVQAYLKKANLSLDVFLDEEAYAAEEYGIAGVPSYFMVDKDGMVKKVEHVFPGDYKHILNIK